MRSIDLKHIVIPWGIAGVFLFLFYLTVYFPLNKALQQAQRDVHRKRYDLAILECSRIMANYPNHETSYFLRAWIYTAKHDRDRAIADYNKVLWFYYDVPAASIRRGDVYVGKGDYGQAIFDYSQAIERHFYYKIEYLKRSWAYFANKDYVKSLKDMRRAQSLGVKIPPAFIRSLENVTKTK